MSKRSRAAWVGATLIGIGLAVALTARSARPPERCADGAVPLGARCCGEGQALTGDACSGAPTRCPAELERGDHGCIAPARVIALAGGTVEVAPFDWEAAGSVTPRRVSVGPFKIDAFEVTEAQWAACVAARGCASVPLSGEPGRPITSVTASEARAYCKAAGGDLPTNDQFVFASAGVEGRRYPWGATGAVCRRAVWGLVAGPCAEGGTGPEVAGARPDGATPEGVHDLAGNVAEWTSVEGSGAFEARGGSFRTVAAAGLRTWSARPEAADARGDELGFRCAYAP